MADTTNQQVPLKAQAVSNPSSFPAGSLFGLPSITRYSEQKENNDGTVTTLDQGTQVDAMFSTNFKQSDIVERWTMDVKWTNTVTDDPGTDDVGLSEYFPYNIIGPVGLNLQNQFDSIKALSGIDLFFWQLLRPVYCTFPDNVAEQNPQASGYSAQTNLVTDDGYDQHSATVNFSLDLPGGIFLDLFYLLDADGQIYNPQPIRAFVSPQYMAGSQRIIQPRVRFNPLISTKYDTGPYVITKGSPTATGTVALGFTRKAVYQPAGPADSPLVFNWQYVREATKVSLSGKDTADIPIPFSGQILSIGYRFFDPSATGGKGASLDVGSDVTEIDLLFGSGLYRYQDTPMRCQRRFTRQHGILLPKGMLCHDMAVDEFGRLTNAYCLNTLDTAGVQVHIDFSAPLSATAYVVLMVEGFRYVAMQ